MDGKIAGFLKAIVDGMHHALVKAKMWELEAEKAGLEAIKESPEPPALRLHPSLSQRHREMVEDLTRSLNPPDVLPLRIRVFQLALFRVWSSLDR